MQKTDQDEGEAMVNASEQAEAIGSILVEILTDYYQGKEVKRIYTVGNYYAEVRRATTGPGDKYAVVVSLPPINRVKISTMFSIDIEWASPPTVSALEVSYEPED